MKIAIVLTVKNEARLLRNNLLYHKAIGIDKAFVFFDNTTDNGKESIADLDFVTVNDSVPAEKYVHLDYLEKFTTQAVEHHTARQCLNTFYAQQQCEALGIDWLISIDADELVCTNFENQPNLKVFFETVEESVEVVNFEVLEALQHQEKSGNIFAEETLFKVDRSAFYKTIYNPFTQYKQRFSWWYGQTMGKGAIRIDRDLVPHNVHRYKKRNGSKPLIINKEYLLHYHAYDAEDFIKKFRNFENRPDTFLSGNNVESIKLLLRDVVNKTGYSEKQLEDYFVNNLMFNKKEVHKLLKNRLWGIFPRSVKPLVSITVIKEIFEKIETPAT